MHDSTLGFLRGAQARRPDGTLVIGRGVDEQMERAANTLLSSYGKSPKSLLDMCFGEQVLKIIPSIPELDGTDVQRPDVCYVGHLLKQKRPVHGGGFTAQPGKRYVFVYMGTGSVPFRRLEAVLPQVFPDGNPHCCVVTSDTIGQTYQRGSVEFRKYVPATELLPHCDWTFCHGGHNTIIQSLLHHVPLPCRSNSHAGGATDAR